MIQFQIGDDVFVHNPQRFYDWCTCITGRIDEVIPFADGFRFAFDAEVVGVGAREHHRVVFAGVDLGARIGTPLSQLYLGNGRVTERFKEIGRSWGYD